MFIAADIVVKAVMLGLAFARWSPGRSGSPRRSSSRRRGARAPGAEGDRRAATLNEAAARSAGRAAPACCWCGRGRRSRTLGRRARAGLRRRAQGTGDVAPVAHRGRSGPAHVARHRRAGDDRLDRALRRPVRHGLGHHERLHRHPQAQTTNLAVVAPGIAEALLATAIGLVAAIPAVVIYNMFARSIAGYRQISPTRRRRSSGWSAAIWISAAPARRAPPASPWPPNNGGRHGRHDPESSDDDLEENHEINVTPFIDVIWCC